MRLAIGEPLRVIAANGVIGELDDPNDASLRRCLEKGYRLTGQVDSVDDGRGELTVQGRKS